MDNTCEIYPPDVQKNSLLRIGEKRATYYILK